MERTGWILCRDGAPTGRDHETGYLYTPDGPAQVQFYTTESAADKYRRIIDWKGTGNVTVHKATLTLTLID